MVAEVVAAVEDAPGEGGVGVEPGADGEDGDAGAVPVLAYSPDAGPCAPAPWTARRKSPAATGSSGPRDPSPGADWVNRLIFCCLPL